MNKKNVYIYKSTLAAGAFPFITYNTKTKRFSVFLVRSMKSTLNLCAGGCFRKDSQHHNFRVLFESCHKHETYYVANDAIFHNSNTL